MKLWYSGYRFCPSSSLLHDPCQVFAHLRAARLCRLGVHPDTEGDVIHTANVLKAILTQVDATVYDLFSFLSRVFQAPIATELEASEVCQLTKKVDVAWRLLYHFGVVTCGEESGRLEVPNTAMDRLVCVVYGNHCSFSPEHLI